MQASVEHLEKHYADLSSKVFFRGLVTYMASGPVCAMVWEGLNAVKTGRVMLGETNPAASLPGTTNGSRKTSSRICLSKHYSSSFHCIQTLPDHSTNRSTGHILDESREKWLLGKISIMFL